MSENYLRKLFPVLQFLVGFLVVLPIAYAVDQGLVRSFGRAYWSQPRELFFIVWPVVAIGAHFLLRNSRFKWLALGFLVNGLCVLTGILGYFGLMALGAWTR